MPHSAPSMRALLDADALGDLRARGTRRHFAKDQTIYTHGDPGTDLLVIETGQVEVSTTSSAGRRMVLAHLGPGSILGEVALLDQSTRSASARAMSDVTGHSVGFDNFRAFLFDHPEVHFALTVELCAKLRRSNEALELRTEKDGPVRLALALLRLSEQFGGMDSDGAQSIPMKLSQSEIGELAGLSRANANRYLRAWAEKELVWFEKGKLRITDPDGLRAIAEGRD
ncbi:Crp/Fnr family transcriptional regulator [Cognatishimia sp. F0-27]|uniref:Crp/Fnr family transcriptional regulator n=1 Tax=Cognatishimia sp. F0-27 TaxID=2816855 RepID=UPI001D0C0DD7|nr:Crp/Fnr family transcriptional regulator [Cognatishimia sp. F0-27]MCC1494603.1 Crp/Fnr family transcriptional regulator [Cognatishimia sp. F0-27]